MAGLLQLLFGFSGGGGNKRDPSPNEGRLLAQNQALERSLAESKRAREQVRAAQRQQQIEIERSRKIVESAEHKMKLFEQQDGMNKAEMAKMKKLHETRERQLEIVKRQQEQYMKSDEENKKKLGSLAKELALSSERHEQEINNLNKEGAEVQKVFRQKFDKLREMDEDKTKEIAELNKRQEEARELFAEREQSLIEMSEEQARRHEEMIGEMKEDSEALAKEMGRVKEEGEAMVEKVKEYEDPTKLRKAEGALFTKFCSHAKDLVAPTIKSRGGLPKVSFVGMTSAGKTSLINSAIRPVIKHETMEVHNTVGLCKITDSETHADKMIVQDVYGSSQAEDCDYFSVEAAQQLASSDLLVYVTKNQPTLDLWFMQFASDALDVGLIVIRSHFDDMTVWKDARSKHKVEDLFGTKAGQREIDRCFATEDMKKSMKGWFKSAKDCGVELEALVYASASGKTAPGGKRDDQTVDWGFPHTYGFVCRMEQKRIVVENCPDLRKLCDLFETRALSNRERTMSRYG